MRAERDLLESHGHDVDVLEADNAEITGIARRVKAAFGMIYSPEAKSRVAQLIGEFQPDVVHVHNFFPLLSPSIYYSCREAGIPVVQTLHNYRLICPNAQLLRDGRVCEDCVGKAFAWPGVLHGCYRGSRTASAAVAAMIAVNRRMGTWNSAVDIFIATTDFARSKLIEGGLPAERIAVKPNFAPDPGGMGDGDGGFALFVGRLSAEKGITTLLSAWDLLHGLVPLKVVGDGPSSEEVARCVATGRIEYIRSQPHQKILSLMSGAAFLLFPSVCYEGLPMVIVEAFSVGLPVLASKLGSMASLIEHGRTGLHYLPGDAEDLAASVRWAVANREEIDRMRREARAEYLLKYTPDRNYQLLMDIYDFAIRSRSCSSIG